MWQQLLPGLRITVFFTVFCGLVYPLTITGICQLAFPHQANGSLIPLNGNLVGSELLAQGFSKPEYFQPRPSAAGNGYDPTSSGGSNYGPTNKASASGLDPHISPDSALAQAPRVAKARGVTPDQINTLVATLTEGPDLGILGEPRVNVLKLNLALDRKFPRK
ncbi:MAG: potassium-transporting ATPase subunit C [Bryobacteraceae bacterium]